MVINLKGGMGVKLFYRRGFWFTVLIIIISALSIFLYTNLSYLLKHWLDTLKYLFAIVGLITTLYNHWKKFNLLINRIRIILFNSGSKWNVQSIFTGEFSEEIQNKVKDKLAENKKVKNINILNNKSFSFNLEGLHFIFDYVDEYDSDLLETKGRLICRINDFYCSYDKSIDIFQEIVTPVFRTIEKETKPENTLYKFSISFKGNNPFLNMVAKNIDVKKIHSLWYDFNEETVNGKRTVKVSEKSLECTTSDITDFQNSSAKFITLVGD